MFSHLLVLINSLASEFLISRSLSVAFFGRLASFIYRSSYLCNVYKVEKIIFVILLISDLRLRSESKITLRLVTSDLVQGVNFPRLLSIRFLFLLYSKPQGLQFFSLFNVKKLTLIHLSIDNKQFVIEIIAVVSFGSKDIYTIVSSVWLWKHKLCSLMMLSVMDQGGSVVGPHSLCHVSQTHDIQKWRSIL